MVVRARHAELVLQFFSEEMIEVVRAAAAHLKKVIVLSRHMVTL